MRATRPVCSRFAVRRKPDSRSRADRGFGFGVLGFEFWGSGWRYYVRNCVSQPKTQNPNPKTETAAAPFPPCPHLPAPRAGLDWRALHVFRETDRGPEFYFACLEYGAELWRRGYAARALLCLDRALGAELVGDEPVLGEFQLPYAAMAWLIAHTPPDVFLGNPRVHFQHYADRMNEPRREQRRWRAWACWALARAVRPDLPNDPKHQVVEPALGEIERRLREHGHVGEADLWRRELERAEKFARK